MRRPKEVMSEDPLQTLLRAAVRDEVERRGPGGQESLAEQLGTGKYNLSRYLRGKTPLGLPAFLQWYRFFERQGKLPPLPTYNFTADMSLMMTLDQMTALKTILREYLTEYNLSPQQLAIEVGIDERTMVSICCGEVPLSPMLALHILGVLQPKDDANLEGYLSYTNLNRLFAEVRELLRKAGTVSKLTQLVGLVLTGDLTSVIAFRRQWESEAVRILTTKWDTVPLETQKALDEKLELWLRGVKTAHTHTAMSGHREFHALILDAAADLVETDSEAYVNLKTCSGIVQNITRSPLAYAVSRYVLPTQTGWTGDYSPDEERSFCQQHKAIIDAVKKGNADIAEHLVEQHYQWLLPPDLSTLRSGL